MGVEGLEREDSRREFSKVSGFSDSPPPADEAEVEADADDLDLDLLALPEGVDVGVVERVVDESGETVPGG